MALEHNVDVVSKNVDVAEGGFDPPTSGLWAQHASSAPLCYLKVRIVIRLVSDETMCSKTAAKFVGISVVAGN